MEPRPNAERYCSAALSSGWIGRGNLGIGTGGILGWIVFNEETLDSLDGWWKNVGSCLINIIIIIIIIIIMVVMIIIINHYYYYDDDYY